MDEKTRSNMYKLRSTWHDVVPSTKLHALDVTINAHDKNWPISAAPSNIHVNPKFLNNVLIFYFITFKFLLLRSGFTYTEFIYTEGAKEHNSVAHPNVSVA